ncbi:putative UDP-GlcNAc:betaGal beta-1,3-N-acetylglucosaminyltransferase LOC100288842 [Melanaphis sacchari]|uniref:putative UDP-GlcNAc:betaGal beta-1,3-N-acetylglucosaminyltransferase LOC100288842 n=1 Tax=Melanaphis sacchari TaxID=742174 RepID=UPI000DC134FA|nr:putative UDP-GlcNAc:betaGal beta-1,3-N-acetylglucosaminyltransferase LOC100288842 [Melanaphis sacchari]
MTPEDDHHHANGSEIHTAKNNWLSEDHMLLNESFKSLSELENLHHYMNTFGGDVCHSWNKEAKSQLLILVDSFTKHELLRQVARVTWLRNFHGSQNKVRVVFFVGKPHSLSIAERLLMENRKYGDIVWTHVPETSNYHRSMKMVSGLDWVLNKCKNAEFVLKVDDQSIVNMPAILKFIGQNHNSKNSIWGFKHSIKPIKTNAKYINYTCEHAYLMTNDAVKKLYSGALEKIPYLSDENQFLTGIVAANQGVNVIHDKHFRAVTLSSTLPNNSTAVERCDYAQNHFIFMKPENKDEWSDIVSSFKICRSILPKNSMHHKSV